ncbi:MAG: hypothetical protein E2P02_18985 [Acidobacteria bacterium]|nr:MAG: hypothetical protein E2P02_18985 [Acidobacteriota bacterium]
MKPVWILTMVSSLIWAALGASQQNPTAYVDFEKHDKLSSEKRRDLADSARDVREKLRDRGIESTEDRDDADVLVVILDRRIEVRPSGENDWGGALKQTHYQSRHILSVRYETSATIEESEVALAGAFVTWKRVAGEVAKDAEKWARDHRP